MNYITNCTSFVYNRAADVLAAAPNAAVHGIANIGSFAAKILYAGLANGAARGMAFIGQHPVVPAIAIAATAVHAQRELKRITEEELDRCGEEFAIAYKANTAAVAKMSASEDQLSTLRTREQEIADLINPANYVPRIKYMARLSTGREVEVDRNSYPTNRVGAIRKVTIYPTPLDPNLLEYLKKEHAQIKSALESAQKTHQQLVENHHETHHRFSNASKEWSRAVANARERGIIRQGLFFVAVAEALPALPSLPLIRNAASAVLSVNAAIGSGTASVLEYAASSIGSAGILLSPAVAVIATTGSALYYGGRLTVDGLRKRSPVRVALGVATAASGTMLAAAAGSAAAATSSGAFAVSALTAVSNLIL